jgi:hypothetical protein
MYDIIMLCTHICWRNVCVSLRGYNISRINLVNDLHYIVACVNMTDRFKILGSTSFLFLFPSATCTYNTIYIRQAISFSLGGAIIYGSRENVYTSDKEKCTLGGTDKDMRYSEIRVQQF